MDSIKNNKMTDTIRVPNIENYIWNVINGELILTLKKIYKTEYVAPNLHKMQTRSKTKRKEQEKFK